MNLTRRKFLTNASAAVGAGFIAGPGTCRAATSSRSNNEGLTFSLLGDIHYDQLDHHDFDWVSKEHPNSIRQIESYSRITSENLPLLMGSLKKTIQGNGCSQIVQIGDLVQGLCGSEQLAKRHCEDAINFLRKQDFGVPFLVTKGNHDITGPGSVEAYNEFVIPFIGDSLNKNKPAAAHFSQEADSNLFVYFDAYHIESFRWFEKLLENRNPNQRLFFVVHPPVVPYNARSTWTVFGNSESGQAKRAKLVELLGRHHAIVLCGHLHKYSLVERATSEGAFTQLAVSSVAYHLDDEPKDLIGGLDSYHPDLVMLEPGHSPETIGNRRAAIAAEKPYIRRFDYGNFWGHAVIRVTPSGVEADIYQFLEATPWKTITLDS